MRVNGSRSSRRRRLSGHSRKKPTLTRSAARGPGSRTAERERQARGTWHRPASLNRPPLVKALPGGVSCPTARSLTRARVFLGPTERALAGWAVGVLPARSAASVACRPGCAGKHRLRALKPQLASRSGIVRKDGSTFARAE